MPPLVIIDLSNILYSSYLMEVKNFKKTTDSSKTDLFKHLVFNSILNIKNKFQVTGENLVIACDYGRSWRRGYFSQYKASRSISKIASDIDWDAVMKDFNKIISDLKEFFPYSVYSIDGAEADDIIYHVAKNTNKDVVIVSCDKDLLQLQTYLPNVNNQYDPIRSKIVSKDYDLLEHVIRGDTSDGVPNILSDDDTFIVKEKRQVTLSKKRYDSLYLSLTENNGKYTTDNSDIPLKNLDRNVTLIDLRRIPEAIINKIEECVNSYEKPKTSQMSIANYFVKNKLNMLTSYSGKFL